MPYFRMEHYKVDVGKIVCVTGRADGKGLTYYLKPQGSIVHDGSRTYVPDDVRSTSVTMMLGIAIGERIDHDSSGMMRSVMGMGVMLDHHVTWKKGDASLFDHLLRPSNSGRDTFCTISEFIPMKSVGDPYALDAYLQINEEESLVMSTREMDMSIEDVLGSLKKEITLFPGDLVGVWLEENDHPVNDGDLIEAGISNIAILSSRITRRGNR
ncbi:MAG TPA: hypothetical protein ENK47_01320 [Euryarchaeota archaeon]|nr:hypothetical protein [Euryarchaeota archaeon]